MSYENFVKKFADNKTIAGGIKSRGHIGMSSGSGAGAPSSNPNKGFSHKKIMMCNSLNNASIPNLCTHAGTILGIGDTLVLTT